MIARIGLPRGYSLDPKSGLLLPNEARGATPLRAPFGQRRRARRGVPYPPAGSGGGGGENDLTWTRFLSEWSTDLGNGSDAYFDTDRDRCWSVLSGAGDGPRVLATAAEGRNYPTENFLQNFAAGGQQQQIHIPSTSGWIPLCAVDDCVTVRCIYNYVTTAATDPNLSNHPFYFGRDDTGGGSMPYASGQSPPMTFDFGRRGSGYVITFRCMGGGNDEVWARAAGSSCPSTWSEWAAFEPVEIMARYRRTAADQWQADIAIYDVEADGSRGELMVDTAGMFKTGSTAPGCNINTRLSTQTFDDNDDGKASLMRGFKLGTEAPDDAGAARPLHEFAAFRIDQGPTDEVPWPVPEYTDDERTWSAP